MKIVVDTNIVFSALLNTNSNIGKLLFNSRDYFDFYSCRYLQMEIQNHFDKIQKYTKLNGIEIYELVRLIESRITFIDERLLPYNIIENAKNLVADIDFDDFAFVATTNYLNATLWTGDKILLNGLRNKEYKQIITTAELLQIFNS
jgi:predicted nucleic acid-binding protein